jgi:hypothetical protein
MFDKTVFDALFNKAINALLKAEKITKATLQELSRSVLEAHHATQDIGYVNRLVGVLSPMNKKIAVLYFKEFSGFNYDVDELTFTKKNKKNYDEAQEKAIAFLEDPLNNIWTWAERNVDVEKKPITVDVMEAKFKGLLKQAEEANIEQAAVVRAFIKAGLKVETLVAMMDELAKEQA